MFFKKKDEVSFKKACLKEHVSYLKNPGCGWYHIFYFKAGQPCDMKLMKACLAEQEQLVLLVIDIGAFRKTEISGAALRHVSEILDFYRTWGKEIILRFAYDTEGKSTAREPWELQQILTHMRQLGDVVRRHEDSILALQGLFVGNWGEMHGSRHLTEQGMGKLLTVWRASVGASLPIAVRRPSQLRMLQGVDENLCLFNDGIFGSETDLGTYGTAMTASQGTASATGAWSRDEELDWQQAHVDGRPNGGEAIADERPKGFAPAARDLQKMHVSYLNSVYEERQLHHWRQEQVKTGHWKGVSGYDYIGAHLGYRLHVKDACLVSGSRLHTSIMNTGFSSISDALVCRLELVEPGRELPHPLCEAPLSHCASGKTASILFQLDGSLCSPGGNLQIQLFREKDGHPIHLANEGNNGDASPGAYLGKLGMA